MNRSNLLETDVIPNRREAAVRKLFSRTPANSGPAPKIFLDIFFA